MHRNNGPIQDLPSRDGYNWRSEFQHTPNKSRTTEVLRNTTNVPLKVQKSYYNISQGSSEHISVQNIIEVSKDPRDIIY